MELTVKSLRESIENKTLTEFKLQEYVKFFAENIDKMSLGAELAYKEYLRKAANYLDISLVDLQDVYNSYRR